MNEDLVDTLFSVCVFFGYMALGVCGIMGITDFEYEAMIMLIVASVFIVLQAALLFSKYLALREDK